MEDDEAERQEEPGSLAMSVSCCAILGLACPGLRVELETETLSVGVTDEFSLMASECIPNGTDQASCHLFREHPTLP